MECTQKCKSCQQVYLQNRDYFGSTPSGGFRMTCRNCMRKNTKQWSENNPDKVKSRWVKRYELKKNAGIIICKEDLIMLRNSLNDCCSYCHIPLQGKGEIEHKLPLSKGGTNETNNLTLACYQCNKEKANKSEKDYYLWKVKNNL
jgi:hypothetical protein